MRVPAFQIDKAGNYVFNGQAFHVKPYWLVPDNLSNNAANPEQIVMAAGAPSAQLPIFSVEESSFEGSMLSGQLEVDGTPGAAAVPFGCLVDLIDDVRKHRITGRPCHIETIIGNGLRPFILPESLFLLRREPILFRATNLNPDDQLNFRFVIGGQRIFTDRAMDPDLDEYVVKRGIRKRYIMPYLCPLDEDVHLDDTSDVTGVNRREYTYSQDAAGHFEVKKITFVAKYAENEGADEGLDATSGFKFRITDETGQQITSDWIVASAGMGTAQFPYILYGSWVIKAGGVVRFDIQTLEDTYDIDVFITLVGRMFMV